MSEQDINFFKASAVIACSMLGVIAFKVIAIAKNTERFNGKDPVEVIDTFQTSKNPRDSR